MIEEADQEEDGQGELFEDAPCSPVKEARAKAAKKKASTSRRLRKGATPQDDNEGEFFDLDNINSSDSSRSPSPSRGSAPRKAKSSSPRRINPSARAVLAADTRLEPDYPSTKKKSAAKKQKRPPLPTAPAEDEGEFFDLDNISDSDSDGNVQRASKLDVVDIPRPEPPPAPRTRGRPRGSKNKPKQPPSRTLLAPPPVGDFDIDQFSSENEKRPAPRRRGWPPKTSPIVPLASSPIESDSSDAVPKRRGRARSRPSSPLDITQLLRNVRIRDSPSGNRSFTTQQTEDMSGSLSIIEISE